MNSPENQHTHSLQRKENFVKRKRSIVKTAATMGGIGVVGGIASHYLHIPTEALATGFGSAAIIHWGVSSSAVDSNEADYALHEGESKRAMRLGVQSVVEAGIGMGVLARAFANIPFDSEASAMTGVVVGGMMSAAQLSTNIDRKNKINTYDKLIRPLSDPRSLNAPGTTIHTLDYEKDPFLKNVPLYVSSSLDEIKRFRALQEGEAIVQAPEFKGKYREPHVVLNSLSEAIFMVPKVTHYPAYDVRESHKEQEVDEMVLVDELGHRLAVSPYKKESARKWPYVTEFQENKRNPFRNYPFNNKRWEYWKDVTWKHNVVVLAQRKAKKDSILHQNEPHDITVSDEYFLLDLLLPQDLYGTKSQRIKEKEEQAVPQGELRKA